MDLKQQLARNYLNAAIYTSGFYADPTNELVTHDRLYEALKSFTLNQTPETPFSLQIMLTNGEINLMPLGLLDLDELKDYANQQRTRHGLQANREQAIPLVVLFAPHDEGQAVVKQLVGTTAELFDNFSQQFQALWKVVKGFLARNQTMLQQVIDNLVAERQEVQAEYLHNFRQLSLAERTTQLGSAIPDEQLGDFSCFMADMHAVQNIIFSAAAFVRQELIGEQLFTQALNDNVRRATFFWVLDNSFYQILYYFLTSYGQDKPKLRKRLLHHKTSLIVQMRQAAFDKAQQAAEKPTAAVDCEALFTDLFLPVAKAFAADCRQVAANEV